MFLNKILRLKEQMQQNIIMPPVEMNPIQEQPVPITLETPNEEVTPVIEPVVEKVTKIEEQPITIEEPIVEKTTIEETTPVVKEQPVQEQPQVNKPKLQIMEDTSTNKNIKITKEEYQIKKTGAKKSNKAHSANRNKTKTANK